MAPHDVEDEPTDKIAVSREEDGGDDEDAGEPSTLTDEPSGDVAATEKLPSVKAVEEEPTQFVRVTDDDLSGDDDLPDEELAATTKHRSISREQAAKDRAARIGEASDGDAGAPDEFGDAETEYVPVQGADLADAETEFVPVGDPADPATPTTKVDAVIAEPHAGSGTLTDQDAADDATPLYVGSSDIADIADDATEHVSVPVDESSADPGEPSEPQLEDHPTVASSTVLPVDGSPEGAARSQAGLDASQVSSPDDSAQAPDVDEQLRRLGMARSTPKVTGSYPVPRDPADTGFYSLPAPNAEQSGRARTARENLARASLAAAVVALTSFPFVAYLAVDRWMELPMVMLSMLLASAVPGVILGLAAVWPADRRPSSTTLALGVIPGLIAAVALTSLSAAWALSDVRLAALGLTSKPTTVMDRVLRDDSIEVAAKGCQMLLGRLDVPKWRRTILSGMTLRPQVAARCLEGTEPSIAKRLGQGVVNRWHRELMAAADEPDEERLCTLATEVTRLPITVGEQDARLLECTLGAPTAVAQRCCSAALTASLGENKRERLDRVRATIPMTSGGETAIGLLMMAFGNRNLSEGQKRFAEATNFEGDAAREVAIEVACARLEADPMVARYLAAGLENECAVDVADVPDGREVWDEICGNTLEAMKSKAPVDALCRQTRATLVDVASYSASASVVTAIRANRHKGIIQAGEDILPPVSRENLTDPDSFLKSSWVGEVSRLPHR